VSVGAHDRGAIVAADVGEFVRERVVADRLRRPIL